MIPIYRAKKIGKDEWVEGHHVKHNGKHWIIRDEYVFELEDEIDPSTLAIHFNNMLDKNGKKIFASLSEDGVGGDICKDGYEEQYICVFNKVTNSCVMKYTTIQMKTETMGVYNHYWQTFEVIGIHKG